MANSIPRINFRALYDRFDAPVAALDCGAQCASYNPSGKPFCCDICQAVPAVYRQEWEYLRKNTDLWQVWRGDERPQEPDGAPDPCVEMSDISMPGIDMPTNMLPLACLGPAHCQREFRAVSCRQFPFFPYLTADYRFIGLAYEWEFEPTCWVISNLGAVSEAYRREFIAAYDDLFSQWPEEIESYAALSEQMREHFAGQKRRIPLLHRNGGDYLLSPRSERLRRVQPERFRRFGLYS